MKEPLNNALKSYYSSKSLSSTQLNQLQGLLLQRERLNPWRVGFFIAALTTCVLFVILMLFPFGPNDLLKQVADEVAYNHLKQAPAEFEASSYKTIAANLSQLDFTVTRPTNLNHQVWILVGARYCSIQGKLAAQIKLKNRLNSQIATLYQAEIPSEFPSDVESHTTYSRGQIVKIWKEKGLLFSLARGTQ